MIVYLDLDRTLFQTSRSNEIWDGIAALYPHIDARAAFESRSAYYHYVGDQYYHDMSAQLESLGLIPEDVYEELRTSELADGRFEFEYCRELIELLLARADVSIFTFGPDDYQRFKVSLCPSLRDLPVLTTLRAKADVLEDNQEEAWLVDDKPIGDELPGSISFVQVSLETRAVTSETIWPIFYDLNSVREFFDEVLSDDL